MWRRVGAGTLRARRLQGAFDHHRPLRPFLTDAMAGKRPGDVCLRHHLNAQIQRIAPASKKLRACMGCAEGGTPRKAALGRNLLGKAFPFWSKQLTLFTLVDKIAFVKC